MWLWNFPLNCCHNVTTWSQLQMQVQLASARVVHDEQDLYEKVCPFPFHSSAMWQGFQFFAELLNQLLNRNNYYFIFCDQQFRLY